MERAILKVLLEHICSAGVGRINEIDTRYKNGLAPRDELKRCGLCLEIIEWQ